MATLSPVQYVAGHDPRESIDSHFSMLADHMRRCDLSHGRWFSLHCQAENLRALMAPRFMSVVLLCALIVGGVSTMG